jgi:LPXTG-site transpeptidase (sortase) family protein
MFKKKVSHQSGVIYQRRSYKRLVGFLFLSLSFFALLLFASPMLAVKMLEQKQEKTGFAEIINTDLNTAPRVIANRAKAKEIKVENFTLTIEAIDVIDAPITTQIKTNNKEDYKDALNKSLIHPEGSAYPGEGKLVYIFGHSINYPWLVDDINALLWRANELKSNDRVKIIFNHQHYIYYVFDKMIVEADQLDVLEDSLDQDILVLQTCWPPGFVNKRLLIFCRPEGFEDLI